MASVATNVFEQDMQDVVASDILNTASMMPTMVPNFPPAHLAGPTPLFANQRPVDPSYIVKTEQLDEHAPQMHILPDHASLGFMNVQIDNIPMDQTPVAPLVPNYSVELAAAANNAASFSIAPQANDTPMTLESSSAILATNLPSHPLLPVLPPMPPAAFQAVPPPFNVVSSSLGGALIPSSQPLTSPPRTATSVSPVLLANSPPSIPTPYASSASQSPTAPTLASSQPPIASSFLPPATAEQIVIKEEVPIAQQKEQVAELLNAMAHDFMVASNAVMHLDRSQEAFPDELKTRIASLSRLAAQLSLSGKNETSIPASNLPLTPPASVTLAADYHSAYPIYAPPPVTTPLQPPFDPAANQLLPDSRKRGPCAIDEQRSVKAMKREPLDLPLSLPLPTGESIPLDASGAFPATSAIPSSAIPPIAHSRPASPPPLVSPAFAAAAAQYSISSLSLPPLPNLAQPPMAGAPIPLDTQASLVSSTLPLAAISPYSNGRSVWGDDNVTQSRHHHSLSAGAIPNPLQAMPLQLPAVPVQAPNASGPQTPISGPSPHVRTSRSGSTGSFPTEYSYFNLEDKFHEVPIAGTRSARPSIGNAFYFGSNSSEGPSTTRNSPSDDDDDDSSSESDEDVGVRHAGRSTTHLPASEGSSYSSPGSDIPAEYRAEVDRVFNEYLNQICSNLDAKDAKGDQIHQTLMAKKMQRLDESPDFRPFKFRIQAFTAAFLEELARQGYTEDKIPMKKIRNYLWHQPLILRFNEDGKKAKSKGNHIWNIEARKLGDGKWEFRPFYRKLAGSPPGIAYRGLRWSWTPRIWDPQASFSGVPVQYSSPDLPPWLSWKDDVLSGVPPPDAESCIVTVIAQYVYDGVDGSLMREIPITIGPVGANEGAFPRSRRPSGASEPPRRSASDSALSQAPLRAAKASRPAAPVPIPIPNETSSTRVIRVLRDVAQKVQDEAESQIATSTPGIEIAKQIHVLDQTVEAMDMEMSGHGHMGSKRLAVAAQQVVIQAATSVIEARNVSIGRGLMVSNKSTALKRVSVGELSDATHDAIVEAVKTNGPASTDVDIIVTAASILKQKNQPLSPEPLRTTFNTMLPTLDETA